MIWDLSDEDEQVLCMENLAAFCSNNTYVRQAMVPFISTQKNSKGKPISIEKRSLTYNSDRSIVVMPASQNKNSISRPQRNFSSFEIDYLIKLVKDQDYDEQIESLEVTTLLTYFDGQTFFGFFKGNNEFL